MGNRSGWSGIVLATVFLAGCQTVIIQRPGGARILTGSEMDEVTAGSAVGASDAAAQALGSNARTDVLGDASAYSGVGPIAGAPFLNYASSRANASASGDELAETGLSSQALVDGANGGASIRATAAGVGTRSFVLRRCPTRPAKSEIGLTSPSFLRPSQSWTQHSCRLPARPPAYPRSIDSRLSDSCL